MGEFKLAMKDCLSDRELVRAGASGLLGAVLPKNAVLPKISHRKPDLSGNH